MRTRLLTIGLLAVLPAACDRAAPAPLSQSDQTATPTHAAASGDSAAAPGQVAPVPPMSSGARVENEQNTIDVFRTAAPATVFVTQNRLVRDQWSMRALEVPAGSGSGFVWDKQGHVVTNFHVIEGARSISVTMYGGKVFPALVVGGDRKKDIAVIKIDAPEHLITPVRLPANDNPIEVGQKALAIGNPFGLDHTLTVGVISATGREVKGFGGVTIPRHAANRCGNQPGQLRWPPARLTGTADRHEHHDLQQEWRLHRSWIRCPHPHGTPGRSANH